MENDTEEDIGFIGEIGFSKSGVGHKVVGVFGECGIGTRPLGTGTVLAVVIGPRVVVGSVTVVPVGLTVDISKHVPAGAVIGRVFHIDDVKIYLQVIGHGKFQDRCEDG